MEAASIFECKEPWFCMSVSFLDDRTLQVQVLGGGGRLLYVKERKVGRVHINTSRPRRDLLNDMRLQITLASS